MVRLFDAEERHQREALARVGRQLAKNLSSWADAVERGRNEAPLLGPIDSLVIGSSVLVWFQHWRKIASGEYPQPR